MASPSPFEIVLETARRGAQRCFALAGKVQPMAILYHGREEKVIIAPLVGEDKDALDAGLRALLAEVGAVAVAVIFEAYIARVGWQDVDQVDREGAARWPGRHEAVTLLAETRGKARYEEARITRDAHGQGSLGAFEAVPGSVAIRFGNFFADGTGGRS